MKLKGIPAGAFVLAAVLATVAPAAGFSQSSSAMTPSLYRGVLVLSIEPGSPADSAGLARGDIILAVNGREVNASGELVQVVLAQRAGAEVTVRFLHGDIDRTANLTLSTRGGLPFLGVTLEPPVPGPLASSPAKAVQAVAWKYRDGRDPALQVDALVSGVALRSPAWRAGLRPGDVITAIDGLQNPSVGDVLDAVRGRQPGDAINLTVQGSGSYAERQVAVELQEGPVSSAAWLGVQLGPAGYQG